jgi:hypothetical protein
VDISGTAGLGTLGKQNHAKSRCFAHTGANWCSIAAIAKALDITIPELADGVSSPRRECPTPRTGPELLRGQRMDSVARDC